MYLDEVLIANAKQSMEEFIDGLGDNEDCMDTFSEWAEEFVNSHSRWWDFPETDLNSSNFNNLLLISARFVEECGLVDQPEDLDTLLRRYGYWIINYEDQQRFYRLWEDAWNEKFPENNEEDNE